MADIAINVQDMDAEPYTYPPPLFAWVLEGKLAIMGCPRAVENLDYLLEEGITHLITLSPEKRPPHLHERPQLHTSEVDVHEEETPTVRDIARFIDVCQKAINRKEVIGVHSRIGRGRASLMAACYLIHFEKFSAEKAIAFIRRIRTGAFDDEEYERVLEKFCDMRVKI